MSCFLVLSETACQADLDAAIAATVDESERFAVLPDHLTVPSGLAALRTNGVGDAYLAQLRCSTGFALRSKRVVGDAVGVLEVAAVADLRGAEAIVVGPVSRGVRKTIKSVYKDVTLLR